MKSKETIFLLKQLKVIEKLEHKILNQEENEFIQSKIRPFKDNIEDIIPNKLKTTLNLAFYKGFQFVFEKGDVYIEKTYNKDKIQLEYDFNNYAVDKTMEVKFLKKLDEKSKKSKMFNSSIAVLEGGVLGFFGIGLPDIPLFIAVIIRNINEIALSYGFEKDSQEEKIYLLLLICASMTKGEKQKEFNEKVNILGEPIKSNVVIDINIIDLMKEVANILSDALLTAKFLQGIPLVGVIGGVVNHNIIHKVGRYAGVKYKKRYLINKLMEKDI